MKRAVRTVIFGIVVATAGEAGAGLPVIDSANLAQAVQQVSAWGRQYSQMAQQIAQLDQQYKQVLATHNSLNGARGMGSLVNDPAVRRYLPNEWGQAMNLLNSPGGYTALQSKVNGIRSAARIVGVDELGLDPQRAASRAFVGAQNQAALNRALSEEGYRQASTRITGIQTLIDRVNGVPDAKDVADLQARIQAEQVMVQNELVKLQAMAQLQQAQRDIMEQQARERSIKSVRGGVPDF